MVEPKWRCGAILVLAALSCASASAADLSALPLWVGKYPYETLVGGKSLWNQKGVEEAMRAAMGRLYFSRARKALLSGPQSPVATDDKGAFVAWSCKAHDCGDNQISVFFYPGAGTAEVCLRVSDQAGKVQDLWLVDGKARPLVKDACLSTGSDSFALLKAFGRSH